MKKKKIFAVLLNPTIDEIYTIENFKIGGTFKILNKVSYPVGKAISFALGVSELTDDRTILKVIAFIGKNEIPLYSNFLKSRNLKFEFIKVNGKTRSNKTINDPINGTTTHIREKGFEINETDKIELKKVLNNNIETGDFVVFSGSIPSGISKDIYFELIALSKKRGAKTILDTSGLHLLEGLKARPNVIKPNLIELAEILHDPELMEMNLSEMPKESLDIAQRARKLLNSDLTTIIITLGHNGAIYLTKEKILYGNVQVDNVRDTVGSGDSFLAGFILNYFYKKDEQECFTCAIACGAANTITDGPGIFKIDDANEIKKKIKIIKLD